MRGCRGPPDDGTIDLAHAAPSAPSSVPAAFAAALEELPRFLPQHGYHPAGLPDLRARIAERYTARGLPTMPEQVLVTAGALHGIAIAFQGLLRRGQRLLVEQPTYPNALDAARAQGLRLLPTALDADDPDAWLDAVERTLATTRPAAAYLMPDFQNPTGRLLDGRRPRAARPGAAPRRAPSRSSTRRCAELWLDSPAAGAAGRLRRRTPVRRHPEQERSWGGLRVGWVRAEADAGPPARPPSPSGRRWPGPVVEQLAACALLDTADAALEEQPSRAARAPGGARRRAAAPAAGWRVPVPAGGLVLWCGLPSARSRALVVGRRGALRTAARTRSALRHRTRASTTACGCRSRSRPRSSGRAVGAAGPGRRGRPALVRPAGRGGRAAAVPVV